MPQNLNRPAIPGVVIELDTPPEHAALPADAVRGLGGLSTSGAEVSTQAEVGSLLDLYHFGAENVEATRRIVAEASLDPKVHAANSMLSDLASRGGEYTEFALGVFTHQRDVAELAVAAALKMGYTDKELLGAVALAGLTHDLAKGQEAEDPKMNLAAVFMYPGKWSADMRQIGEKHPVIGAQVQREVGLSELVQYLTERHHKDLRENPERHVKAGGYGGESITPPAGMEAVWGELAHIFSAADDIAANTRERGYKPGMTPAAAVNRLTENLVTPDKIVDVFRRASTVEEATVA